MATDSADAAGGIMRSAGMPSQVMDRLRGFALSPVVCKTHFPESMATIWKNSVGRY